ncbi:hypothetical protein M9H77_01711 [Catharanthus roseus]|uniref:Uncharacterized protein n=1 Tax=Catharanthus roseus TaxID=4058 RepID=A0ACC0C6G5_CATRO|nr:hypothetical protein M9H77_01711 [Catharanthus roseus]
MNSGALARITCLGVDKYGYESAPFSLLSCPTDSKDAVKITECKAFLESSPLQSCNCPTDENYGKTGATLSSYRFIADKKTKLYSVKPFVYTQSKPISEHPKGY